VVTRHGYERWNAGWRPLHGEQDAHEEVADDEGRERHHDVAPSLVEREGPDDRHPCRHHDRDRGQSVERFRDVHGGRVLVVGEPPEDRVARVVERVGPTEQRRDDDPQEQDGASEPHPPSRIGLGGKRRRLT
jgi:hypothetical protein